MPIRVELGPKDIAKGEVVAVRRLTGEKITIKRGDVPAQLLALLDKTHQEMLERFVILFYLYFYGFVYIIIINNGESSDCLY